VPFDRHRCVFVHIPKAAGTALAHGLLGYPKTGSYQGPGHTTLRQYALIFREQEFRRYFKFTFVRNPWDRLHSAFTYLKQGGWNQADRAWAEANLAGIDDFESFVCRWLPAVDVERSWIHLQPQYLFLRLQGDRPSVNFIGRFETLESDYQAVASRLGVRAELEHLNKTRRSQRYRDAYTDEMKEIVANVYRKDIELFGYEFDHINTSEALDADHFAVQEQASAR
jgi:hypothetical protein